MSAWLDTKALHVTSQQMREPLAGLWSMLSCTSVRQSKVVALCLIAFFVSLLVYRTQDVAFQPHISSVSSTFRTGRSHLPILELDGVKLGRMFPGLELNGETAAFDGVETLSQALMFRYAALGAPTRLPQCSLNLSRYDETLFLSKSGRAKTKRRISFALNLYESQDILPALSVTLLRTISLLRNSHEIYISVFENDSKDGTISMLGELAAALAALEVDGIFFRHSMLTRGEGTERILALANIRNEAMAPLIPYAADGAILFINDVVTCPSDLLELVHQLRLQDAHVVMSSDYEADGDGGDGQVQDNGRIIDSGVRFRDTWVARGINGDLIYDFEGTREHRPTCPTGDCIVDMYRSQDEAIHERWVQSLPVPVYSGWNGAVAMDAALFTSLHVRFRASHPAGFVGGDSSGTMGHWGKLLASSGYLQSDCAASECKLFARDVWNLKGGQARFVHAPQSNTAYSVGGYERVQRTSPVVSRTGVAAPEERINWTGVAMPSSVVCVQSIDEHGDRVGDAWQSERVGLDPRQKGWGRT